MKNCIYCSIKLSNINQYPSYKKVCKHYCKECAKRKNREWCEQNREKSRGYCKKYCSTDNGKLIRRKNRAEYYNENRQKEIDYSIKYNQLHKDKKFKCDKKYRQSENGKLIRKKLRNKRRRNLGFNILYNNPFSSNIKINWHHINNIDVVAIPEDLHQLYLGKNHRENMMYIVKQIYKGGVMY